MMANFRNDERGVVAVIFALMAIPFIALGGWAVDYLRLKHVQDVLQAEVDAAALNALVGVEAKDRVTCLAVNSDWEPIFRAELAQQYEASWARDIDITGGCVNGTDFRVNAQATVSLAFMNLMPGIEDTQLVTASATSRLNKLKEVRGSPETAQLDDEAGDFNRLWMYCYWPERPENDPDQPKRTKMVPIADNGGSTFLPDFGDEGEYVADEPPVDDELRDQYDDAIEDYGSLDGREEGLWYIESGAGTGNRTYRYYMPDCQPGSHISFRLENVRFARTKDRYWDSGAPSGNGHQGRFNYYTDTFFNDSDPEEHYDDLTHPDTGQPVDIVETVLCDTLDECKPESAGGVVPEGRNRDPERATGECISTPGNPKYMYYGWEDRPPGQTGASNSWRDYAWTDSDFDDIVVVIKCPEFVISGERNARLIR